MVIIDIPVLAYKTYTLTVYVNGEEDPEADERLAERLKEYKYNEEHEHVK